MLTSKTNNHPGMSDIYDFLKVSKPTSSSTQDSAPISLQTMKANSAQRSILSATNTLQKAGLLKLEAIVENNKSTIGSVKQLIKSALQQASTDRSSGTGIIEGARSFADTISEIKEILSQHATERGFDSKQQTQFGVNDLGNIASSYTKELIRTELIEGAAESLGITSDALTGESLFDITRFNLGLLTNSESATLKAANSISSATTRAVSTSTSTSVSSAIGLSAKILGGIGAAYSGFQLISNWGKTDAVSGAIGGFTTGAYIGGMIGGGPFGAAVGGVVGGLVGLASSFFKKTGKSAEQLARDQVRDLLRDNNIINKDWQLTLADGSLYDIGKDGGYKLSNTDGTTRNSYEVDSTDPLAGQMVAMMQPIAALLTGGDPRLTADFAGYFTNAALSKAQDSNSAIANALVIYQSFKISPEQIIQSISALAEKGVISKDVASSYLDGFNFLLKNSANGG